MAGAAGPGIAGTIAGLANAHPVLAALSFLIPKMAGAGLEVAGANKTAKEIAQGNALNRALQKWAQQQQFDIQRQQMQQSGQQFRQGLDQRQQEFSQGLAQRKFEFGQQHGLQQDQLRLNRAQGSSKLLTDLSLLGRRF